MSSIPPAIILINADMSDQQIINLKNQLFITESVLDTEFKARLIVDPTYPTKILLNNLRVLIISTDIKNLTLINASTIRLFIKQGLISILDPVTGIPKLTIDQRNVNIYQLLRFVKSPYVTIIPDSCYKVCDCKCSCINICCKCKSPWEDIGIGGVAKYKQGYDVNILTNYCDTEYTNEEFIKRK